MVIRVIVGRAEDSFGEFLESAKAFRWTADDWAVLISPEASGQESKASGVSAGGSLLVATAGFLLIG